MYTSPVRSFRYIEGYLPKIDNRYGKAIPGFIAEELEETFPISVDYDRLDSEDPESEMAPSDWNVKMIVPAMMRLIQDLNDRLTVMESVVTKQPLNKAAMLYPPKDSDIDETALNTIDLSFTDEERADLITQRVEYFKHSGDE